MKVLDYLMEEYEWEATPTYHRFAGIVDIYQPSKRSLKKHGGLGISVAVLPENAWYYPKDQNELADIAINHIEFYKDLRKKKHMDNKPRFTNNISGKRPAQTPGGGLQRVSAGGLTDTSKITFGQYKGDRLIDIDASYLLWLHDNNKCPPALALYISANLDVLQAQAKQTKR